MSESLGISIQNMCYQCQALDTLCPECLELKDSRDIYIAHQIVDENYDYLISTFKGTVLSQVPNHNVASGGSMAEPRPLSSPGDEPSSHDWIGSVTKLIKPVRDKNGDLIEERYEFLPPITNLSDRFMDLETSMTVLDSEVVCKSCHLVYNKHQADCPVCF